MTVWRGYLGLLMVLLLACSGLGPDALAAESATVASAHATATLITDTDAAQPGKALHAGLWLKLAPGWHTYWRNPGDAGLAPTVDVQLSPPGKVGPIEWPLPTRIAEAALTTYGYQGEVVLPFTVTPQSAPFAMHVHASWLICRDICVPEETDLSLDLPLGTQHASPQASLFAAAASATPSQARFNASITPDGTLLLSGDGLPAAVTSAQFFPYGDGQTEVLGAQRPIARGGKLQLTAKINPAPDTASPVEGIVALTNPAGTQAFVIKATPAAAPAPDQTLPWLLLLALAGGLLLNLMPCVFPVLAMKAMALARMSGADRTAIRMQACSYCAGVIVAFTLLGLALATLRQAGQVAGWGFQFQSPSFVTVVTWLLFAIGLNLSGVFTVGASLVGAGQGFAGRKGHAGSFCTGLLAVVVATPCTASFMGAAMAGALAASLPVAAAVFAAMGLGLALPYALVAALPQTTKLLPRPGAWMEAVRQGLAFPMYAAAAWLVWVASQQAGPAGVLIVVAGLVAVGFAAWSIGATQASTRPAPRYWGRAAAAVALAAAIAMLSGLGDPVVEPSEPFSAARLAELRNEGRPVFVNMTAAWCISCLVNERIALAPQATRQAFARSHVAYLKGDWTRQDPAISDFLRQYGRDGVPLYVYYPPGRAPEILPQILTGDALLQEIGGTASTGG